MATGLNGLDGEMVRAARTISLYESTVFTRPSESRLAGFPLTGYTEGERRALIEEGERCEDYLEWCRDVDDAVAGRHMGDAAVLLPRTPGILRDVGMPDLPVLATKRHISLGVKTRAERRPGDGNVHNIRSFEMKMVPEYLSRPVAVARDRDASCAEVYLSIADRAMKPLMVPLRVFGEGRILGEPVPANFALSIYGRSDFYRRISLALAEDRLLYVDSWVLGNLADALRIPEDPELARLDGQIGRVDAWAGAARADPGETEEAMREYRESMPGMPGRGGDRDGR